MRFSLRTKCYVSLCITRIIIILFQKRHIVDSDTLFATLLSFTNMQFYDRLNTHNAIKIFINILKISPKNISNIIYRRVCTHPSNKLLIKDGFMSTWNVVHRTQTINFWDWHLNINKYNFIDYSTPDSKANNALCIVGKNPPPYK